MAGSKMWMVSGKKVIPMQTKKTKKGASSKKQKSGARAQGIPLDLVSGRLFAPIKRAALKYNATFNMNTGTASLFGVEQVMRLNSLFDPDLTGTGHQPMGFDELMGIYSKYKVNGCRVTITWTDSTGDGVFCGYKIGTPNDGVTLFGQSIDRASESRSVLVKPINNSGSQVVKQSFYIPTHIAAQITKNQFSSDLINYTGNASSPSAQNPIVAPLLRVAVVNPASATNQTVVCRIQMTFYASFYQRLSLPGS